MEKRNNKKEQHYVGPENKLYVKNEQYEGEERRFQSSISAAFSITQTEIQGLREVVDRGFDNIKETIFQLRKTSDYKDAETLKRFSELSKNIKKEIDRIDGRITETNGCIDGRLDDLSKEIEKDVKNKIELERHSTQNTFFKWLFGLLGSGLIATLFYIFRDFISGIFN